jgi:hypothetical protein
VRRLGWFVAGAATATGAVAAGAVALRRLRGPEGDELPAAVGFDEVMWAEPEAPAEAEEAEAPAAIPVRPVADDERAAELRTQIAESRRRLRAKAKAATGESDDAGADDEEPTSEH